MVVIPAYLAPDLNEAAIEGNVDRFKWLLLPTSVSRRGR